MTLTNTIIALEGAKERAMLNAAPIVDLLMSQVSDEGLEQSGKRSAKSTLRATMRQKLMASYAPKYLAAELMGTAQKLNPLPSLNPITARGIISGLEQGKITGNTWRSFGRYYAQIEATAARGG